MRVPSSLMQQPTTPLPLLLRERRTPRYCLSSSAASARKFYYALQTKDGDGACFRLSVSHCPRPAAGCMSILCGEREHVTEQCRGK